MVKVLEAQIDDQSQKSAAAEQDRGREKAAASEEIASLQAQLEETHTVMAQIEARTREADSRESRLEAQLQAANEAPEYLPRPKVDS